MARSVLNMRSLQAKLVMLVVLVATLVLLAFSALDYFATRSEKFAELEVSTQMIAERAAQILLRPVWNVDLPAVGAIVSSIMEDRRVYALAVLEEDGSTVFYGVRRGGARLDVLPTPQRGMLSFRQDLVEHDQYVGSVAVIVTPEYVYRELWEQVFATGMRTVAVVAALGVLVLLLIRRVVLQPIKRLSNTTEMISTERTYSLRAEKNNDDEIGTLIDSFNAMLEQIEQRDHMLNSRRIHLETLVQERTQELVESRGRAEKASKAKSEFVANMSHEIRTPMNAIIGLIEIVQKTELTTKQREYLTIIRSSARSLLGIVNDILDFSKIEAQKLELERIPFSLRALLEEVTDLFGDRVAQKGVELVLDIDGDAPDALEGDPLRLKQVLVNLVTNAFKFTDEGEVIIGVEVDEQEGDSLTLAFNVTDTGIGIKPEQREKLFDSFMQADGATTRRYGGSGLGLAISKELVQMMSGRISVQSEVGKGSEFRFTAQLQLSSGASEVLYDLPVDLHGMRVMLVEDNDSNRRVMEKMLTSFGLQCDTFASGVEAYEALRRKGRASYGLILLDWMLPEMDGLEIVTRVRQAGEHLPPVMLLTAYGRESEVSRAEELGISSFLMKPVKVASLHNAILHVFGYESHVDVVEDTGIDSEFAGVRVLLVEDNVINQQVAREVLESEGLIVEVAGDGMLALDMLRRSSYDVVFMDIQMPTMDGFETTRRIRGHSAWDIVPIIAMTAHVMSEDREEALRVGMNDYLTKPIDRTMLFNVLRKWVGKDVRPAKLPSSLFTTQEETLQGAMSLSDQSLLSSNGGAVGVAPETSFESSPEKTSGALHAQPESSITSASTLPASLPGLDVEEALTRVSGKVWLFSKIVVGFQSAYCGCMKDFRQLAEEQDLDGLERKAHTLAGAAGSVSANIVRQKALALEQSARERNTNLDAELDALSAAVDEACQSMAEVSKMLEAPEG